MQEQEDMIKELQEKMNHWELEQKQRYIIHCWSTFTKLVLLILLSSLKICTLLIETGYLNMTNNDDIIFLTVFI